MTNIDSYSASNPTVQVIGSVRNELEVVGLVYKLGKEPNIGDVKYRLHLPSEGTTAMVNGLSFEGIDAAVIFGGYIPEYITEAASLLSRIHSRFPEQPLVFFAQSDPYLPSSSIRGLEALVNLYPHPGIVFHSTYDTNLAVQQVALGINATIGGSPYISIGSSYMDILTKEKTRDLSEREIEVLRLMTEGQTNKEIAASLTISPGTSRTHVAHILKKLDARNRTEAVTIARTHDLI